MTTLHLITPESVLVKPSKAVDNNRDRQGKSEDTKNGTQSSKNLSHKCLNMTFLNNYLEVQSMSYIRINVIAHSGDGHEAPPETFRKRPGGIHLDKDCTVHEIITCLEYK